MTSSRSWRATLYILAFVSITSLAAQAGSVLTWTGGTYVPSAYQQTVGWQFVANQTVNVSSLQWYDPTGTNLAQHTVDVWTDMGALAGTACVGSGCAGSFYAGVYWQTPVSFSLAPGTYDIGGWVDVSDPFIWYGSTVATDPSITFGMPVFLHSAATAFPGNNTCCGAIGFYGPNFTQIPEPSSLGLLGTGLVAGAGFLRRRLIR